MENPDGALENVGAVSDMRAAHERKKPVVNARKARCQNFESNFIWGKAEAGGGHRSSFARLGWYTARTIKYSRTKRNRGTARRQPPESHRSIAFTSSDSSTIGLVM
jgi:hypothetical protein